MIGRAKLGMSSKADLGNVLGLLASRGPSDTSTLSKCRPKTIRRKLKCRESSLHAPAVLFYFRTIHVYDTDKESFEMFLKFIYTGHLETESTSLENLVELIALADRYEVIFRGTRY